ncbi:hypothetical protein CFP56_016124 [Quercus suber]|uniref:Zinc knuckle CX2CX4HX4C domain-containing protein n=1 Tax=Quercus suber TaxID=58331 RepID=A0AAW0KP49_QUESU
MTVGNIRLEHASLWIQIWGAPLDMASPQVAREVGNRIGRVEEVEGQRRQDDLNYFMRVKVAMPTGKPLRRGGFIAGSDGVRSWVTFKYERLPLFCHYCGLLGHDVKHCASHFALSRNGGEVDYQYGEVEEVEGQRRQDDLNYFMRVKVAMPIGKPLRRGGFIAGSDGVRSWVTFKYERLPLFCHYCGLLGHDVKHCALHFALSRNGGEVDYQYGESLRASGGRTRSFSPRNTSGSAGAAKEQKSEESTNYSPMQETFPAAGAEGTNPSKQVEGESENLGKLPSFQEGVNVELGGSEDVQNENTLQLVSGPVCEGTDVEQMREVTGQPAGVELIEVATGKNKEEVLGVETSGLDQRKIISDSLSKWAEFYISSGKFTKRT